jgi:hypothetical protein
MADLVTGLVGSALLCSIGIVLAKLCTLRDAMKEEADPQPEYILLSKEQYDFVVKKIIIEQPQMPPSYSEKAEVLAKMPPPPLIAI